MKTAQPAALVPFIFYRQEPSPAFKRRLDSAPLPKLLC
jgi:hypothetical protein